MLEDFNKLLWNCLCLFVHKLSKNLYRDKIGSKIDQFIVNQRVDSVRNGVLFYLCRFFCHVKSIISFNSHIWKKTCILVLYTGTRLYRNTDLVASISEPVFPLLSIRYSFWYIFSPKYFKMQGWKLERQLLFCFELDASALLCRRQIVTMRKNSRDFLLRQRGGSHSRLHLPNKIKFLL